jgi:type II secretory pathway component PulJ
MTQPSVIDSGSRAAGFTIIEIMVSILIFIVVALAMVTILMTGTDLYRHGEYSRSANDEAVAVIGSIDDDLKRILPATDGGFVFSDCPPSDDTGNTVIAFAIANPNQIDIGPKGEKAHLMVAYWVFNDDLYRTTIPMTDTAADQAAPSVVGDPTTAGAKYQVRGLPRTPEDTDRLLTTGCLHLGAWIADHFSPASAWPTHDPRRALVTSGSPGGLGPDWESAALGDTVLGPWRTGEYDTDPIPSGSLPVYEPDPYPSALRISVTLTGGGRFGPKGHIARDITDSDTSIHVLGVKSMPSLPGSAVRIGKEWVAYHSVHNGIIECLASDRGARRSKPDEHKRGDVVQFGKTFSLVRTLSH